MIKKLIPIMLALVAIFCTTQMRGDSPPEIQKEIPIKKPGSQDSIMTNYTADASDPAGIIKLGYSSGTSITEKRDYVYTETSTQANDHMGNFIIQYADNIVLSQTNSAATLKTYNTGYIQAMIYSRYE